MIIQAEFLGMEMGLLDLMVLQTLVPPEYNVQEGLHMKGGQPDLMWLLKK